MMPLIGVAVPPALQDGAFRLPLRDHLNLTAFVLLYSNHNLKEHSKIGYATLPPKRLYMTKLEDTAI